MGPAFATLHTHLLSDFIYSEYLTTQRRSEFRQLVWQIAMDYASAALLLRLPGHVPMPAFQVCMIRLGVWSILAMLPTHGHPFKPPDSS